MIAPTAGVSIICSCFKSNGESARAAPALAAAGGGVGEVRGGGYDWVVGEIASRN
jgi:hypothetical protein